MEADFYCKTPILSFQDREFGITFDVSCQGDHHGIDISQIMASLSRRRPVLKPLFFTVKALLAQHDLASVRTGGANSVILLSMVSSFLEVGPSRSEVVSSRLTES